MALDKVVGVDMGRRTGLSYYHCVTVNFSFYVCSCLSYVLRYSNVGYSYVKCGQLRLAHLSAAERSYPTSEVRGRSWEDPMLEGWQPRGVTPRPWNMSEVRGSV